jgi:hypothetical protein
MDYFRRIVDVEAMRTAARARPAPNSSDEPLPPLLRAVFVALTVAMFVAWLAASH